MRAAATSDGAGGAARHRAVSEARSRRPHRTCCCQSGECDAARSHGLLLLRSSTHYRPGAACNGRLAVHLHRCITPIVDGRPPRAAQGSRAASGTHTFGLERHRAVCMVARESGDWWGDWASVEWSRWRRSWPHAGSQLCDTSACPSLFHYCFTAACRRAACLSSQRIHMDRRRASHQPRIGPLDAFVTPPPLPECGGVDSEPSPPREAMPVTAACSRTSAGRQREWRQTMGKPLEAE